MKEAFFISNSDNLFHMTDLPKDLNRCPWCLKDQLYIDYHDQEWGVPIHDETRLFEFLVLEGMQAGLSWLTVLRKRTAFRTAFHNFDPSKVARFTDADIHRAIAVPGIIKHRKKLESATNNAQKFLEIQQEQGSFNRYIWQFVEGKPIQNCWKDLKDVPCFTPKSDAMARDLKQRGFQFIGTKICYSLMQAVGMVNDHLESCFRHTQIKHDQIIA